ncbi:MAG: hypothetical protein N2036_12665 [Bryobacteraceae bacterium]|nr:hypothetical protein [Bryobacteraceae bacterium]MCX7604921.1 hypothetical protein [Bryobacteraceae bacterium]
MKKLAALVWLASACFGLDNSIRIHEAGGSAQSNRPFTALMVFMQGEFPQGTYPKPRINGSVPAAWQTDIKSRWPDGSVLSAFVSFPVTLAANGNVKVDFVADSNPCHLGAQAVCEAAALDQAGMLNFLGGAWNARIRGTANGISYTVDARTMLAAGAWRYWLQGPVVTRVIVEDMSPSLAFDFGWQWDGSNWQAPSGDQYKGIHPMFELSFYPGWNGVETGYKLEAPWRTRFIRTSSGGFAAWQFTLEFLAGAPPAVVYSKTGYNLTAKGAVTYWSWSGTAPGEIFVDRNFPYLVASRILPPYDLSIAVSTSQINSLLNQWPGNVGTDDQGRPDPRSCTTGMSICAYVKTSWPDTGDHPNFGIIPGWQIAFLYAMGDSRFNIQTRKDLFDRLILGSAEAAITAPVHTRESYTNMSPPLRNYLNWPADQVTPSFGRIFSVTAQYDGRSLQFENSGAYPAVYVCTNCPATNKPWVFSVSHYPSLLPVPYLLTGRYLYLSSLQQWAASILGSPHPQYDRHYDWGIHYSSAEPRVASRPIKAIFWGFLLSPDSPERNYFADKLKNIDAAYEGAFDVRDGLYASQVVSNCAGAVTSNASHTFNSSHPLSAPNGQRRVFAMNGWDTISNVTAVTVNGSPRTFGIYGQDTGRQWYYIPGGSLIIQNESDPPLAPSDTLVVNYQAGRSATPWCKGFAMMRGLSNPLPMIGVGTNYADMEGAAGTTGTSPWMVSYLAMTLGWARQTRALAVNGGHLFEKSAAKLGKYYIDGVLHPRKPALYSGAYRTPTADGLGLITTWERYIAARNPPVALASAMSSSDMSFVLNCRAGALGCINVPGREAVFRIDEEYIRTCAKSVGSTTTTFTVCPGGRGFWGTKAQPHTTSSTVNAEWRLLGDFLSGHTYPNLWVNALAFYYDVAGSLGSGREAYHRAISMGTGLEMRANDQRYAFVPRIEPYNLKVLVAPGRAEIHYDAPTLAACRYAVTQTWFSSPDDSGDTADRGGLRTRRIVLDGLAPGVYRYRVTCGPGRLMGSFTVPPAQ